MYYSAHSSGTAYTYSAVDKVGVRPVVYSAAGSHANYATAGTQKIYPIVGNIVTDTTDAGFYWDVSQNYRGYYYDVASNTVTNAGGVDVGGTEQATETVDWLYWSGMWGDEQYPTSDKRQNCALGVSFACGDGAENVTDDDRLMTCVTTNPVPLVLSPKTLAAQLFVRRKMVVRSKLRFKTPFCQP